MSAPKLIGVGVGPGDPELMTLKAMRAIGEADVVAYFAKAGHASHSLATAAPHLRNGATQLPLLYPVTTELPKCSDRYRDAIRDFFDTAAATLAAQLEAGRGVRATRFLRLHDGPLLAGARRIASLTHGV